MFRLRGPSAWLARSFPHGRLSPAPWIRQGATTIREVIRLEWVRAEPGVAVATVMADAFCHNMVRALAGALLAVGDGGRPATWLAEVLAARRRDPAVRVAPPHPLCLEEVAYPDAAGLAARALRTRRSREIPCSDGNTGDCACSRQ